MNRLFVLLAVAGLGACTDHRAAITGTQSLQIELTSPADPGSISNRLPDAARAVSLTITAMNAQGEMDTTYNNTLQVYVYFLGTLTPYLGGSPLATVQMVNGQGSLSATLPPVFGPTTIWFDDGTDSSATYATGVSPTLWYRDPFISDIQTPVNEMAINALTDSPLENKNVTVALSRYGARGAFVITSLYSSGYTLADVQCADDNLTPPCTSQNYDYIDVYSYSAPQDQLERFLDEGQIILANAFTCAATSPCGFAGGVSNFDGLIEIGFPQTFVSGPAGSNGIPNNLPTVCTGCEPPPVVADFTGDANDWFANPIQFKRNQSAVIEIDNAKVCELDSDYTTFNEWKIDPSGVGGICTSKNIIDIVTAGTVDIDPSTLAGKTLPKLVGTLRPISETGFNVWLVYPRSLADITTN
jgi:hypothetical protein